MLNGLHCIVFHCFYTYDNNNNDVDYEDDVDVDIDDVDQLLNNRS